MAVEATGLVTGELLSVAMVLPGARAPIVVDARVVHAGDGTAGLAFLDIRPKDAGAIEQLVWDSLCPEVPAATARPPAPPKPPAAPPPATPPPTPPPAAAAPPPGVALRVPLDTAVVLTRRSGPVEARATGLSPGGIAVRGVELEDGEPLEVELTLPGAPAPVRAPGVVARRGKGIAGIRFVGSSQAELRSLESLLWTYLRVAVRGPAVRDEESRPRPDRTESILAAIDERSAAAILEAEDRVCEVEGCGRPHKARGLCSLHYSRWRRSRL